MARGLVRQATSREKDHGPGAWGEAGTAGTCLDPSSPIQAREAHENSSFIAKYAGTEDGGGGQDVNGPPESANSIDKEGKDRSIDFSVVERECAGNDTDHLEGKGERGDAEREGQPSENLGTGSCDIMHVGDVNKSAGAEGKLGGSATGDNSRHCSHILANGRLEIGMGSRPSEEPGDSPSGSFGRIVGGASASREDQVQIGKNTGQRSSSDQSSLLPSGRNYERTRRGRAAVAIQACARRMAAALRVSAIRRETQTPDDSRHLYIAQDTPQPRKPPQQHVPMLPIASVVIPSTSGDQIQGAVASKAPREPLAILRRLKDRPEDQPKLQTDQFKLRVTTRSAIEAHVRKTGALRRKAHPLPTPPSWRPATAAAKHNKSHQPRAGRRSPLVQPRAVSPLHRSVTQLNWFVSAAAAAKNREGSAGPSSRRVQDRFTCAIFEAEKLVDREFARRGRRMERLARLDP